MVKCWEYKREDRPTFRHIHTSTASYIERIAGYLEMNYNPFYGMQGQGEALAGHSRAQELAGEDELLTAQVYSSSLHQMASPEHSTEFQDSTEL